MTKQKLQNSPCFLVIWITPEHGSSQFITQDGVPKIASLPYKCLYYALLWFMVDIIRLIGFINQLTTGGSILYILLLSIRMIYLFPKGRLGTA